MPRNELILSAFVASPGDVSEERTLLENIVNEINMTWRKKLNVSIELLKWETHVTPGSGSDPQKVINENIGDDYDIFIGIMWQRFGSATSTHESGTAEEFSRAYERWEDDPASVEIMFYFNKNGVSLDDLDMEQAAKIKTFKKNLGEEGTLYWNYKDLDNFEKLLRVHLSRVIQKWVGSTEKSKSTDLVKTNENRSQKPSDDDSLGLIDLLDSASESIAASTESTARIAEAMEIIGEQARMRTGELGELEHDDKGRILDLNSAKRIFNRSAEDLDRFSVSLKHEIPISRQHLSAIAGLCSDLATVMNDFDSGDNENLEGLEDMLTKLIKAMKPVPESVYGLRDNIASMPRVSVKYNRAKRNAVKLLDSYLDVLTESSALLKESKAIVQGLYDSIIDV